MSQSQRQQRLRLLVKKLNRERKRQASQIDILCNDLIGAQRAFVKRLNSVGFAATFYKSLLGATDLRSLLVRADQMLRDELPGVSITFFLRPVEGGQLRAVNVHETPTIDDQPLEDYFGSELVDGIYKSNRQCTMNDLFGMGLHGNLSELGNVSLTTLPLANLGRPLGFLLLSRAMPAALTAEELHKVDLISCGLSHAIAACRQPIPAGE
ncbi:MAG: GAF domain-containing protein [Phycisphaerae bacterium]|nr:GAF domain-containing protein [Phycisphaerae bacterium]